MASQRVGSRLNHWTIIHTRVCVCVCGDASACACGSNSYPEPADWIYSFPHIEAAHPYFLFRELSTPQHPRMSAQVPTPFPFPGKAPSSSVASCLPFILDSDQALSLLQWLFLPFGSDRLPRPFTVGSSVLCVVARLCYTHVLSCKMKGPARRLLPTAGALWCLLMAVMMAKENKSVKHIICCSQ